MVWALCACSSAQGSRPGSASDGGPDAAPGDVDGARADDASGSATDSATVGDARGPDGGGTTPQDGAALDGQTPGQDGVADVDAADASIDLGPPPIASCVRGATWGAGTSLSVSTASDDWMGAITPDELTIAWVSVNGSSVSVLYADRPSISSAFGAPGQLPAATGYYASPKVGMSPDGLRLIVVKSDNTAFAVATRTSRAGAFGLPASAEFDAINGAIANAETTSYLADPVIGASDRSLYFSVYGANATLTLFESTRTDSSAWPGGVWLVANGGAFAASGSMLRHPTGVSADDLTLLYWDDVAATEMAAWRPFTSQPFDHFETLGALKGAAPNAACDKLYYSAPGSAGGLDLFVAPRM
jgi:hypothetical protein